MGTKAILNINGGEVYPYSYAGIIKTEDGHSVQKELNNLKDEIIVTQSYFDSNTSKDDITEDVTNNTFSDSNTKYVIVEEINFDGTNIDYITIGKGSTLQFYSNAKFIAKTYNNTKPLIINIENLNIIAPLSQIFDGYIKFSGTFNCKEVYPEWWGAVGDGTTDDAAAINKAIEAARHIPVVCNAERYLVESSIIMSEIDGITNDIFNYNPKLDWYDNTKDNRFYYEIRGELYFKHDIIGSKSLNWPVIMLGRDYSKLKVDGAVVVKNTSDDAIGVSLMHYKTNLTCLKASNGDNVYNADTNPYTTPMQNSTSYATIEINAIVKGPDSYVARSGWPQVTNADNENTLAGNIKTRLETALGKTITKESYNVTTTVDGTTVTSTETSDWGTTSIKKMFPYLATISEYGLGKGVGILVYGSANSITINKIIGFERGIHISRGDENDVYIKNCFNTYNLYISPFIYHKGEKYIVAGKDKQLQYAISGIASTSNGVTRSRFHIVPSELSVYTDRECVAPYAFVTSVPHSAQVYIDQIYSTLISSEIANNEFYVESTNNTGGFCHHHWIYVNKDNNTEITTANYVNTDGKDSVYSYLVSSINQTYNRSGMSGNVFRTNATSAINGGDGAAATANSQYYSTGKLTDNGDGTYTFDTSSFTVNSEGKNQNISFFKVIDEYALGLKNRPMIYFINPFKGKQLSGTVTTNDVKMNNTSGEWELKDSSRPTTTTTYYANPIKTLATEWNIYIDVCIDIKNIYIDGAWNTTVHKIQITNAKGSNGYRWGDSYSASDYKMVSDILYTQETAPLFNTGTENTIKIIKPLSQFSSYIKFVDTLPVSWDSKNLYVLTDKNYAITSGTTKYPCYYVGGVTGSGLEQIGYYVDEYGLAQTSYLTSEVAGIASSYATKSFVTATIGEIVPTSSTELTYAKANSYYVSVEGDTVTGDLVVNKRIYTYDLIGIANTSAVQLATDNTTGSLNEIKTNQVGGATAATIEDTFVYITAYSAKVNGKYTGDTLAINGSWIPYYDSTYALGSETNKWSVAYLDNLYVKGKSLDNIVATGGTSSETTISSLITDISYSDLANKVTNKKLIPGMQYRINDYFTYTTTANTQSAYHQFDIIVTADNTSTLNAHARAIQNENNNYFATSYLNKWELKYDINNDTTKYQWADATNGKGVIYYMKDEWNNECPYDFKNIMYQCYTHADYSYAYLGEANADFRYTYTFNVYDVPTSTLYDASLNIKLSCVTDDYTYAECFNNTIKPYALSSTTTSNDYEYLTPAKLNNIVFLNSLTTPKYSTGNKKYYQQDYLGCDNNFIDANCFNMTFNKSARGNKFGIRCNNNIFYNVSIFNTFLQNCSYNTFKGVSESNVFMQKCANNIFLGSATHNTFGQYTGVSATDTKSTEIKNTFGNELSFNQFGIGNYNLNIGDRFKDNTVGNYNYNIDLGNNWFANHIGNYSRFVSFYGDTGKTSYLNNICGSTIGDDIWLYNFIETSSQDANGNDPSKRLQNINIIGNMYASIYPSASVARNDITINTLPAGTSYEWTVAQNSNGEVKQFCVADLIK